MAACTIDSPVASAEGPLAATAGSAPSLITAGTARTLDDEFADLVAEIPGFGGLYYDADGAPVVYMKNPSQLNGARARVAAFLGRGAHGNTSRLMQITGEVGRLRVRSARYDFRELRGWYDALLMPAVFTIPGVVMTDIDERRNQIVIGVRDAGSIRSVRTRLSRLGVPVDAFDVVEYAAVPQEAPLAIQNGESCDPMTAIIPCDEEPPPANGWFFTLRETLRPVIGGIQIQYHVWPFNHVCTVGYNIAHRSVAGTLNPTRFFMTASHCGDAQGTMTGMSMGQPTVVQGIGVEVADPDFLSSSADPQCPSGRQCRYSDAALFAFEPSIFVNHGRVAFPPVGSLTFTEIRTISSLGDPVAGMAVEKIGRTTGRTAGTVQETCVQMIVFQGVVDTGRTLLCQFRASYSSAGGDSGSPVVQVWPDGTLVARGIHWRGNGGFSPINAALRELSGVTGGLLGPTVTDGVP